MFSEAASTLGIRPAIIEKDFARRSPALVGNARLFSDKRVIRFPDRDSEGAWAASNPRDARFSAT